MVFDVLGNKNRYDNDIIQFVLYTRINIDSTRQNA